MNVSFLRAKAAPPPWWLVLIQGIALLVVGILLMAAPLPTTILLVQILGLYWLVAGILALVGLFTDSSLWGWKLFVGILGILAGLAVLRHPLWSTLLLPATLVICLGILGLIMGVVGIFEALSGGGWGAAVLGGANIILGIILLLAPLISAAALPIILGIFAIIGGIAVLVMAFRVRSDEHQPSKAAW